MLPARDETLARLEARVAALVTGVEQPEHRRLPHTYPTWRVLRRLRRWTLVARLLHDDTPELTDRVAGAFLLCYGQQLPRIAMMTTEQVHRHDDVVSLRFGAHDLTVPQPLSVLLTGLIDVGRSHLDVAAATSVSARPPPARGCSPGTYQDIPSHPLASANTSGRWASQHYPAGAPPSSSSPPRSPGTATRWTRDAGADWSRYAADIASIDDHQR